MSIHLQRDLERLKKQLLTIGSLVEEAIQKAMKSLTSRDEELARQVIHGDSLIDQREVEIEEQCLKSLALNQPVADDLRFIVVALKVNNDLERMADHAVNIAKRAKYISRETPVQIDVDFDPMVKRVGGMVRKSLESLVNIDPQLARETCAEDNVVDDLNRDMILDLQEQMRLDPARISMAVDMLSASKNLERIADLATNIAEDVVFLATGEVNRHVYVEQQQV